jgi:hypothetical protein
MFPTEGENFELKKFIHDPRGLQKVDLGAGQRCNTCIAKY